MANEFWSSNSLFDQKTLQNIELILKTLPLLFPFSYFLSLPKLLTFLLFAAPREAVQSLRFCEALYASPQNPAFLLIYSAHWFISSVSFQIHSLFVGVFNRKTLSYSNSSLSQFASYWCLYSSLIFSLNASPMYSVFLVSALCSDSHPSLP